MFQVAFLRCPLALCNVLFLSTCSCHRQIFQTLTSLEFLDKVSCNLFLQYPVQVGPVPMHTLRHRYLKTEVSFHSENAAGTGHFVFVFEEYFSTRDYHDVIVFRKLRFWNVFRPHYNEQPVFSNPSGLKSVFVKPFVVTDFSVDGRRNIEL